MREKYAVDVDYGAPLWTFKGIASFIGYGTRWQYNNFTEAPFIAKGFWEDIAFKVDPPMLKKKEKYMEDGEEKEREILVPEPIKPMFSKEGFEETFGGTVQKETFQQQLKAVTTKQEKKAVIRTNDGDVIAIPMAEFKQ